MPIFQQPTSEILFGPSPIDWCEANKPETNPFHVQEFHNTWTNIAYVFAGINPLVLHLQQKKYSKDPLYILSCLSVIMTGVTSAWFHATLMYAAQKSDEFFENAAVIFHCYYMIYPLITGSKDDKNKRNDSNYTFQRNAMAIAHVIFLGTGVLYIPEAFCEIHLILAIGGGAYVLKTQRIALIEDEVLRKNVMIHYNTVASSALVAFSFWLIDFFCCTPLVRSLNLHAFAWHFLTALAMYEGCISSKLVNDALWQQEQNACKS